MPGLIKPHLERNDYEELILQRREIPERLRSIWAGVSRATRLSRSFPDLHAQTIWDTGADVIGPTFFFFVSWALQEAKKQGFRDLYFLARDGQILREIAQTICRQYSWDIECRYLHGSRQAWLIPAISLFTRQEIDWLFSELWYVLSVRSVCRRLGSSPEDMEEILGKYDFPAAVFDRELDELGKKRLQDCLMSEEFGRWFHEKSRGDFENIIGYFRQEGLFDCQKIALVDIGWRGNQQAALNKILIKAGHSPRAGVRGFYFGLTEAAAKLPPGALHSFLFDLSSSPRRFYLRNNNIYEAFAASAEGRTIGFGQASGRFVPVLASPTCPEVLRWRVELQHESILAFVREFCEQCPVELKSPEDVLPGLEATLHRFLSNPSFHEAETYGRFPMDSEMTESNIQEIAPVVTRREFWRSCLDLKRSRVFWMAATLRRSKLSFERMLWKWLWPLLAWGYGHAQRTRRNFSESRALLSRKT